MIHNWKVKSHFLSAKSLSNQSLLEAHLWGGEACLAGGGERPRFMVPAGLKKKNIMLRLEEGSKN